MQSLLLPKLYVDSIHHIDLDDLKARGIDTIVTDLDNTLVPWAESEANPNMLAWLENVRARGFKICLLSNALEHRIAYFRQVMGVPGLSKASKPSRRAFLQALEMLGSQPAQTAMVGDQIFTDVLGGNRLGLYTILVLPLCQKEFIGTRLLRLVERMILRNLVPTKKGGPRR